MVLQGVLFHDIVNGDKLRAQAGGKTLVGSAVAIRLLYEKSLFPFLEPVFLNLLISRKDFMFVVLEVVVGVTPPVRRRRHHRMRPRFLFSQFKAAKKRRLLQDVYLRDGVVKAGEVRDVNGLRAQHIFGFLAGAVTDDFAGGGG